LIAYALLYHYQLTKEFSYVFVNAAHRHRHRRHPPCHLLQLAKSAWYQNQARRAIAWPLMKAVGFKVRGLDFRVPFLLSLFLLFENSPSIHKKRKACITASLEFIGGS
jgi:hypothetical protein